MFTLREDVPMLDFISAWIGRRRRTGRGLHLSGGIHFAAGDEVSGALARAREEALSGGHRSITTAHLLLALLEPGSGADAALDPTARYTLRSRLHAPAARKPRRADAILPYDDAASLALKEAMAEAEELGHGTLAAGHLLAGIVREGRSPAARALGESGLTLPVLRSALWPESFSNG